MPTFEEDMEMLLSGLRAIKTPSGMQQRILATCACFARIQRMSSWNRMRPAWLKNLTHPDRKNLT
jgi:hypothetical protein